MAEKIKCKPPKKIAKARIEPVRQIKPQSGSTDDSDSDLDLDDGLREPEAVRSRPVDLVDRAPPADRRSRSPVEVAGPIRVRRQPLSGEPLADIEALRDKYRPKVAEMPANDDDNDGDDDTKADSEPTGTILLEPIRPPTPPLEEIKVEPITPTYVEMKKPLKSK